MVVFDKANHSNMLYTNPKHDISDKVLRKMGLKPGDIQDDASGSDEKEEEPSKPGTNPATKTTKSPPSGNSAGKRK